jgi:hypothetical protein
MHFRLLEPHLEQHRSSRQAREFPFGRRNSFGLLRPPLALGLHVVLRAGWWAGSIHGSGLKTPLPRKLTFTDPEKIRELARRGEAWGTSEARQLLPQLCFRILFAIVEFSDCNPAAPCSSA